jgi:hypothetical protein
MKKNQDLQHVMKSAQAVNAFERAVVEHENLMVLSKSVAERAFNCGSLFLQAKDELGHGEWATYVDQYADRVVYSTIRKYMGFFAKRMELAAMQNPQITNRQELESIAWGKLAESGKSLAELLREVNDVKQLANGEAETTTRTRSTGATQLSFHFEQLGRELSAIEIDPVRTLSRLAPASLDTLETQLTTALQNVRSAKLERSKTVDVQSNVLPEGACHYCHQITNGSTVAVWSPAYLIHYHMGCVEEAEQNKVEGCASVKVLEEEIASGQAGLHACHVCGRIRDDSDDISFYDNVKGFYFHASCSDAADSLPVGSMWNQVRDAQNSQPVAK